MDNMIRMIGSFVKGTGFYFYCKSMVHSVSKHFSNHKLPDSCNQYLFIPFKEIVDASACNSRTYFLDALHSGVLIMVCCKILFKEKQFRDIY